jgi:hypothetical protein
LGESSSTKYSKSKEVHSRDSGERNSGETATKPLIYHEKGHFKIPKPGFVNIRKNNDDYVTMETKMARIFYDVITIILHNYQTY